MENTESTFDMSKIKIINYQPKLFCSESRSIVCRRLKQINKYGTSGYENSNLLEQCTNNNNLIKYIIVWDLDETLIFFDEFGNVQKQPLYYIRPYANHCLEICNSIPQTLTVLWSLGEDNYVQDAVYRCGLSKYFDLILTRTDSENSFNKYYVQKSICYILNNFNLNHNYTTVSCLIDDKAYENSGYNLNKNLALSYNEVFEVKPFDENIIYNFLYKKGVNDTLLLDVGKILKDFYIKYESN